MVRAGMWRSPWLVALVIASCGEATTEPDPTNEISAIARSYLESALDIMEGHSINRYKIEWTSFRANAAMKAGAAQTAADTYDAIRYALVQLGDGHSFFRPPPETDPVLSVGVALPPAGKRLETRLGYVRMPPFSEPTATAIQEHADRYHALLQTVDTAALCGWVVDLRENLGGNMWPMLAGIGPVLGDGVAGYFVDADSVVTEWFYLDGSAGVTPSVFVRVSPPYHLLTENPTVAVLTNGRTASSGEAIVTAFRGRPNTRSFGVGTWGVSTANAGYPLSDGAMIILTVAIFADRTGRLYGSVIEPDEVVEGEVTGDPATDPALARARDWLFGQPACVSGS